MNADHLGDLAGTDVSRETFIRLQRYHDLLLQWSKTHNLIGPKEREQVWERHIADSLQIWPFVKHANCVLDIGSGAGFPGLVLASVAKASDGPDFILVEASSKRCAFLRHVARELGLKVEVLNARIEDVSRETPDLITARAVADLSKLLEMGRPWLENGAKAAFLKGQTAEEELTEARHYWNFKIQSYPSKTDSRGVVLSLSEVSARHD